MRTWAQVKDLDQRLKTVHAIILYLYQDPKRSIPIPTSKVDENGHQKRISILESGVLFKATQIVRLVNSLFPLFKNNYFGNAFLPTIHHPKNIKILLKIF